MLQAVRYTSTATGMSMAKAFALMCCVFSLFVQVAAHAAAVPQAQTGGMDCADMAQGMPLHEAADQDEPTEEPGCCPDMTLGCLVAMNCLSPLAIAGTSAQEPARFRFSPIYLPMTASILESGVASPESPPPQFSFTA